MEDSYVMKVVLCMQCEVIDLLLATIFKWAKSSSPASVNQFRWRRLVASSSIIFVKRNANTTVDWLCKASFKDSCPMF